MRGWRVGEAVGRWREGKLPTDDTPREAIYTRRRGRIGMIDEGSAALLIARA